MESTARFLAVRDERMYRRQRQVGDLLAEGTPADFFEAVRKLNTTEPREEFLQWYMLDLEFWLFAMRNPDVSPQLAEREQALLSTTASLSRSCTRT